MRLCWCNGFLRRLILLRLWLFRNNEDEVLNLDDRGERRVDVYGSDGSPFARLVQGLRGGDTMGPGIWASEATTSARIRGEQGHSAPGTTGKASEANDGSDGGDHQEAAEVMTTTYLVMSTLQETLSHRLQESPHPLAVAAADPRARLAGDQAAVLLFSGVATSLHCDAATGLRTASATQLRRTVAASKSHKTPAFTCHSNPHSGLAASVVDDNRLHCCCVVRGSLLEGITAVMCKAAWWYGRPRTSTPTDPALEASHHLPN